MKPTIDPHPWKLTESTWNPEHQILSESLFALGNGRMGQRANNEEGFSGKHLQGTYIAGVYYPDKTKVGWWKNGYPEYFAKVLNAVNFIGIHVRVNGEVVGFGHRCAGEPLSPRARYAPRPPKPNLHRHPGQRPERARRSRALPQHRRR